MTTTLQDLHHLAQQLETARRAAAPDLAARELFDAEQRTEAARPKSFWERALTRAFRPKTATLPLTEREQSLAQIQAQSQEVLDRYIEERTAQLMHQDNPDALRQWQDLKGRSAQLSTQTNQATGLHRQAHQTLEAVNYAQEQARKASRSEIWDMALPGAGTALMSAMHTADAEAAIKHANGQLKALAPRLKELQGLQVNQGTNETLDLLFDSAFDLFSWKNKQALDKSVQTCGAIREKLAPLVDQLYQQSHAFYGQYTEVAGQAAQLTQPYRSIAQAELPAGFQPTLAADAGEVTLPSSLVAAQQARQAARSTASQGPAILSAAPGGRPS